MIFAINKYTKTYFSILLWMYTYGVLITVTMHKGYFMEYSVIQILTIKQIKKFEYVLIGHR